MPIDRKTNPLFLNIGAMRHRVQIYTPSASADGIGDTAAPTLFATRWAEVKTLSGTELYRSQQFTSEANGQIILRYLPGVVATMTVVFGSRTFELLYVDDVNSRHVKLVLFTKEVT